ncbi:MAG: hypothetical protein R2733_26020 [Acidimicrobiales bacterium]
MRTRARNVLFIPLLCVFLVAACAPDDPIVESGGESSTTEPLPWAEEALIWHRAMDEMLVEQGGVAWEYFWDPDVKFDYQPMIPGAGVYHAAFAFAFMYRLLPEGQLAFDQRNVAYVSTSGTLTLGRLDWAPSGMDVGLLEHPADIVNILEPIGLNGAERMLAAFSVDTWRERYDHEEIPSGAEALARQWVEDWTSGELSPSMYRDDVQLIDSIDQTILSGFDEVAARAGAQASTEWTMDELGARGLEVYPLLARRFELEGVLMLVSGDDGVGCPSRVAVRLDLVEGKVSTEVRYREVEDARRCLAAHDLPDGWWSRQNLNFDEPFFPAEDLETVTGFILYDGDGIELYNSTEHLDHLVEWAIGRFREAGLEPAHELGAITFTQYIDFCSDVRGRAIHQGDEWRVYLCFHEEEACSSDACEYYKVVPKRVILHELAHPWIEDNIDAETQAAFLELVGLDVWADPDTPWHLQAREHAAETIAWGLLDVAIPMPSIGSPDEDTLRQQFLLLTGVEPIQPGGESTDG